MEASLAPVKKFLLAAALLALLFGGPLWQLFRFASADELHSYVILIPFLCLYLGWLRLHQLRQAAPAPAPSPTGPPPKTPVMQVTPAPGDTPSWMEPRPNKGDPKSAPFGNLLDQPVVNAPRRR